MNCDCEVEAVAEYFSKDFDWEELKAEVEANPCLAYHLLPFEPSFINSAEADVDAWRIFHTRHSTGKFFKVVPFPRNFLVCCVMFLAPYIVRSSRKLIVVSNSSQERRYLLKEFPELVSCAQNSKLLEVGCGNGSTVLPVLR